MGTLPPPLGEVLFHLASGDTAVEDTFVAGPRAVSDRFLAGDFMPGSDLLFGLLNFVRFYYFGIVTTWMVKCFYKTISLSSRNVQWN